MRRDPRRSHARTFRTRARRSPPGALALLALGLHMGCSGAGFSNGPEDPDGGLDAGDDAAVVPDQPSPPARPELTPCPPGWREVTDAESGTIWCDPWPEGGPRDCAIDEAHFPGTDGCERVGTPCPEGPWPEGLPADATVLYVSPDAEPDGDGSRDRPFATIAEALLSASDGDVLALAKGTFDEVVPLRRPVTLWGACASETILASSRGGLSFTVVVDGNNGHRGGSVLRNLQLGGRSGLVNVQHVADPLRLESVVAVPETTSGAFMMIDGPLVATDFVLRFVDAAEPAPFGIDMNPWQASQGAHVEVTRGVFENLWDNGLTTFDERTEMVLRDVALRLVPPPADDSDRTAGIIVSSGARVRLERVALVQVRNVAIGLQGDQSSLVARDVVVQDGVPELGGRYGGGIQIGPGTSVSLDRTTIRANQWAGVLAFGTGARLTATDLVVGDTVEDGSGMGGVGIDIADGATAELVRVEIDRNRTVGMAVRGKGTVATGSDVTILDTRSRERDGDGGEAIVVSETGQLDLVRVSIESARRGGVLAYHPGSRGRFEDLRLESTLAADCATGPCEGAGGGCGFSSIGGAALEATVFLVEGNALCGVQVVDAELDLHRGGVFGNPIGANVQDDDFDVSRLQDRVLYRDNERTLDTAALPVPAAFEGIGPAPAEDS